VINLFQLQREGAGSLPGALACALAVLLEHAERRVLAEVLALAGVEWPSDLPLLFAFPAEPETPAAEVAAPGQWRLLILARALQPPWEEAWLDRAAALAFTSAEPARVLLLSPVSRRASGEDGPAVHLSWEQLDRLLDRLLEHYGPESRTAFLVDQFRQFLAAEGLAALPGLEPEDLAAGARGLTEIQRVGDLAGRLFGHAEAALRLTWPDIASLRAERPEDVLAGYFYRDLSGTAWSHAGFLRLALNLPQQALEVTFWLAPEPAGVPGEQLRQLADRLLPRLAEQGVFLRLWSEAGEQQVPAADANLSGLAPGRYQIGFQLAVSAPELQGEGQAARVSGVAEGLLELLSPLFGPARALH
jgi:hypothetical protein